MCKNNDGAVLPRECNVVIMKEEITLIEKDKIKINSKKVKKFQNIRFAGRYKTK